MAKKPIPVEPESCGSCRFFQPNAHDDAGWCRRFPPVPVVIETSLSAAQATSSADEWCGESAQTGTRPCKCGSAPAFTQTEQHGIKIMRLECKCGHHGATLMYRDPADEQKMKCAAVFGWNLGH